MMYDSTTIYTLGVILDEKFTVSPGSQPQGGIFYGIKSSGALGAGVSEIVARQAALEDSGGQ